MSKEKDLYAIGIRMPLTISKKIKRLALIQDKTRNTVIVELLTQQLKNKKKDN